MAGFLLTRQAPVGKWGAATFSLMMTDENHEAHRGHRVDMGGERSIDPYGEANWHGWEELSPPIPPIPPMPSTTAAQHDAGRAAERPAQPLQPPPAALLCR